MPRRKPGYIPQLTRHAHSGLARVTLSGIDHYCGPWPSEQTEPPAVARAEYDRLISEWIRGGRRPLRNNDGPFIAELIIAYMSHAEKYYRRPDGTPTGEADNARVALRPLQKLFGRTLAAEFGPLKLQEVRESIIAAGICRNSVNKRIGHIKRMMRWAMSKEMIPATNYHGLQTVPGLKAGRTEAHESGPVKPVPAGDVAACLPFLRPPVRAMVELQRLTGMRPGEVVEMRPCLLDISGPIWTYRPTQHKTGHKGKDRIVCIGPQAQAILQPFLRKVVIVGDKQGVSGQIQEVDPAELLFSPARDREARFAAMRARRKSKVQPSQLSRKRAKPKRLPLDHFDLRSYRLAIIRACEKAGVTNWHPNQLRHLHATEVRKRFGLEAAQVALGHSQANVTQIYAERNLALAERVAAEVG